MLAKAVREFRLAGEKKLVLSAPSSYNGTDSLQRAKEE